MHRNDQDLDEGIVLADPAEYLDTVHFGDSEIHQYHVRPQFSHFGKSRQAGSAFSDHFVERGTFQIGADAFTHQRVILDDEDGCHGFRSLAGGVGTCR
ncbi:MAG: hypothetical protein O2899_08835 [Bacteroidetes bacterium]|nr:hypothetical protein [Bacteroidota bacterium]